RYAGALDRGWAEGLVEANTAPVSHPWQVGLGALGTEARSTRGTAGGEPALPCHLPMSLSECHPTPTTRRPLMSLEPFPADPGLPQLKIASGPELMREMFRRHLCPLPGKAYHISDCHLSWVRYLRGVRCTLQYTLRLVEPGTGRTQNQWVSGVIYAEDRAERIWQKLRAVHPGQEVPQAFLTFEPVSFIPDLNMVVHVFPYERRLPALPLLMTRPSPDPEHQLLDWFGPGNWHADVWNIEPIRYRAGARAVLRYEAEMRDAATGRREKRRFYVKVYRGEEGERTYQVLQALWRRPEAGGEGFTIG